MVMTCDESAIDKIIEYFQAQQWILSCAEWPNKEGGACFVSWMEEGYLCSYEFDYLMEN